MRVISNEEHAEALRELDIYGYCVIEKYFEKGETALYKSLVNEIYRKTADTKYAGRPERDQNDKMIYNLVHKDLRFLRPLMTDSIKGILKPKLNDPYYRFLPPEVPNYYLGYYNARSSGDELDLHIDSHIPSQGNHTWSMQAAFLLDDHRVENGCTKVVPGSHLSGKFTDRSLTAVKPVIAQAGDMVLWDSRLWHGTYPNKTGADRWALIATLVMWWIKPSMDMARSCPKDVYAKLNDEEKALLGFCSIPPKDEFQRVNTKLGYADLKEDKDDFFR